MSQAKKLMVGFLILFLLLACDLSKVSKDDITKVVVCNQLYIKVICPTKNYIGIEQKSNVEITPTISV